MSRTEPMSRLWRNAPALDLGRAAADVEQERLRAERADAAPRQLGLFVAAQEPRAEAVRPLDLAEERLAVLGVAHGAGGDGERALGAERLELAPVVGQHVAHARDRHRQQPAARVDALAEARDDAAPHDLDDVVALDVRDEQARRVGAEVDGRDARHLRGTRPRTRRRSTARLADGGVEHRERGQRPLQPRDRLGQPRRPLGGGSGPVGPSPPRARRSPRARPRAPR